ncbi:hypothetical protein BRARA_G02525 [Brassica rapa]|uniref:Uncharacterized protein n=1 Tax=Brassica campestris TaxID=3711 RepID=A0A397YW45_BRACM|nr:uncharacterized protein LOC106357105 isoform X2 [Brassica napus]XP_022559882.1 uncharacterized protein LOC106409270 isoform X2 [Brassica napus]RID55250.1 hypothetical protein BRARA_G02525 [Brassica rapa]
MAIEVCCSEAPDSRISPRNSFSYDLDSTDGEVRLDSTLLDSGSDLDFCFGSSCSVQEVSPADELFSDGKILPVQIKKRPAPEKKIMKLKDLLLNPESDFEDKAPKGLFLQFKRSISLNYDKSRNSKGLIRSLQFLSRSNSTGSALNPKPNLLPKENHHPHKTDILPKQTSLRRSSSLSASVPYRKPLARNSFGNGNGGVRVSPVLNFPPPAFISNVADGLFSIGSLCNGRTNRKTRL